MDNREANTIVLPPGEIIAIPNPLTPIDLLHAAINKGIDPEGIKTLSEVMLKMQAYQAEQAFNSDLAHFQAACPIVLKRKKINFPTKAGGTFTSHYAEMSSIVDAVRDLLTDHGFSYSFDREVDDKSVRVHCILRHSGGHQTRTLFSVPIDRGNKLSDAHAIAGAVTFCERYSFRGALGITTGDSDNDGKEFTDRRILPEQVEVLKKLMEDAQPNLEKFWRYVGVESLEEIFQRDYGRVEALLLERRKELQRTKREAQP